jgi:phosphatidylinositol-3-phosphatase
MNGRMTGSRLGRRALSFAGGALLAGGVLTAQAAPASSIPLASTATRVTAAVSTSAASTGGISEKGATTSTSTAPHIMMIVEENTSYQSTDGNPYLIGNPSAPYLNSLASTYTSLSNWYSYEHHSSYDYFDLISGFDQYGSTKPYADPTLVNGLDTAGFTWKAYMDGLTSGQNCYTGSGANNYMKGHNPFVYFKQIISNTSECDADVVPYSQSQLQIDLNSPSAPDFVWITPNACNDMHSKCAPTNNPIAQGDTWLKSNLPTVLGSNWYAQGGIVIVTWDEGAIGDHQPGGFEGAGGRVPTLVISQNSCGSYSGTGNDFATLRGIEEAYGVTPLLNSGNASYGDITPAFTDGACGGGGTGTISGLVTNAAGGSSLAGVTVTCTCNGGATASTTNGSPINYSFANVAIGTYSLTFSDAGFGTQVVNNVGVTSGGTTPVNVAMVASTGSPHMVQDVGSAAKAATSSFSVTTGSTGSGDLLAISTEFDAGSGGKSSGSVISVTDNQGETWKRATAVNPSTRIGAEVWYEPNATGGVTSVTVTFSNSVNPVVRFYEVGGASSLDRATSASGTSTSPNSGLTGTTSSGNELAIGAVGFVTVSANISGLSPGFTDDPLLRNSLSNFNNSEQGGHVAISAPGTFSYAGALSGSQAWAAVVATFM